MDVKERIIEFLIDPNSNVLLVEGSWGIGKSFVVDDAIKGYKKRKKKVKQINLSLFGVSDVKEANQKLIIASRFSQKLFKKLSEVGFGTSYSDVTGNTISFEINGVFQALMLEEYKENIFSQAIIVIDDIERKDRKISIVELMGFVDSLKLKKTKIILIANSTNLCSDEDKKDFQGFKEKIIDYEIRMQEPTEEAKQKLITDKSVDYSGCCNLRTIQKYNNIKTRYLVDNDIYKNQLLFSALDNIENYKIDKNKFIEERISEELFYEQIGNNVSKDRIDNIKDNVRERYKKYSKMDIFTYYVENDKKYYSIERYSLSTNAKKMYEIIENCEYDRLNKLKLTYEQSPKARYPKDDFDFYLNYDLVGSVKDYLESLKENITSCRYDIMSMTTAYCEFKLRYHVILTKEFDIDKINEVEDALLSKTVSDFLDNKYSYENSNLFDFSNFVDNEKKKVLDDFCYKLFSMMYKKIEANNNVSLYCGYCAKFEDFLKKVEVLKNKFNTEVEINGEWFKKLIKSKIKEIINILLSKTDIEKWQWHESLSFIKLATNELNNQSIVENLFLKASSFNPNNERIKWFINYYRLGEK